MFGYRLIRDTDYDRLHAIAGVLRVTLDATTEKLANERVKAAGACARADYLTIRNTVLEKQVADLTAKVTGLPQPVATLGSTDPSRVEEQALTGLEGLTEAEAADAAARGQLHDAEELGDFMPGAEGLTPSMEGEP